MKKHLGSNQLKYLTGEIVAIYQ